MFSVSVKEALLLFLDGVKRRKDWERALEGLGFQDVVSKCYSKWQNEINSRVVLILGILIRRVNHMVLEKSIKLAFVLENSIHCQRKLFL